MSTLRSRAMDWVRLLVGPVYSAVHTLPKIVAAPSYWPERPRKSPLRRYLELLWERVATGSTNLFYNAYGQDTLGSGTGGATTSPSEPFGRGWSRGTTVTKSIAPPSFATS